MPRHWSAADTEELWITIAFLMTCAPLYWLALKRDNMVLQALSGIGLGGALVCLLIIGIAK